MNRGIPDEIKGYVIDYDRVNDLTAGELMQNNMGAVNTKSVANRAIKELLRHFNETIVHRKELCEYDEYVIDTLKFNNILVNQRSAKIKKIFKEDGEGIYNI